jgi:rifamycin polyketide synthase module 1/2/3
MFKADLIAPISALMARHRDERGSKVAYRDAARSVTYGELDRRTANLASGLAELGLSPGEHVAILLPNSVNWVESCFATVRAGGIAVPISIEATADEIAYRFGDTDCRIAITTSDHLELLRGLQANAPALEHIVCADGSHDGSPALEDLASSEAATPPRDPDDIDQAAFLIYTSGTTGQPKGVRLTCRGMLWVTASCWSPILELDEGDTVLSALPLFHSYALNLAVVSILATGATIHLMEKYSTSEALRLLGTGEFTVFPGVPTMFHYLMEAAQGASLDGIAKLRACVSAGAIMPATLNQAFEGKFGVPLLDGYGITETSTMVTMNSARGGRVMGSCGLPIIGLAVRIVDPETKIDCAPDIEGELIVRGPNLMLGYLNKPEETAKALRNGWYHTGDLAKADRNGFLTITGRIKELIIRGGQNIAPAEIEETVLQLEEVLDCAVVALPDERLGEVPGLFVIARGETISPEAIREHCRKHLSSYKIPAVIERVNAIPRTGSGKIIRFKLREAYEAANPTG